MRKEKLFVSKQDFLKTYKYEIFGKKALQKYGHWFPVLASPQLADIAACIISDGYLEVRKRGYSKQYMYFGFYSKYEEELEKFNDKISKLFGIKGVIKDVGKRDYGFSKGCLVINATLTRILTLCGVPANDKVSSSFCTPEWILHGNKDIKRSFLRSAFSCEGSIGYDKSKGIWEIRFFSHRIRPLFNKGLEYMNSYISLLKEFDIETTNAFIDSTNIRTKDGMESIGFCFKVLRPKSILNFAKHIGFDIAKKNERLIEAVKWVEEKGG